MIYLILCDTDKSYCILEDYELICDDDQPPTIGEKVYFYYGKNKYSGTIVDMSGKRRLIILKFLLNKSYQI